MDQPSPSPAPRNQRRQIVAWCLYDWANSAYSTIYITVLVGYLQSAVLTNEAGVRAWGWGIGVTMMVAAVLSPILGAIADSRAKKRAFLFWTTLLGSGAAGLMYFATPDRPWLLVVLFLIANLNYELAQGFYNAFLPEIADDQHMGRVSAWGYGVGYIGGGLMLLIALLLMKYGGAIGLPEENYFRPRICLALMGLWWAAFSLPMLLLVRDRAAASQVSQPLWKTARNGLTQVMATIREIRKYRMLAIFLLGFLIFNDGVQTMISQASVFGMKLLDMRQEELLLVILMIQFVAFPGALLVGWLADWIGPKTTLNLCLGVWIAILVGAYFIDSDPAHAWQLSLGTWQLSMPVGEWEFWGMAIAVAIVLGGTQSVSRAIMGLMTPTQRSGEFFGFFNLSGKAVSMVGPILFSEVLAQSGNARLAVTSLLVFFVVGWLVILPLDIGVGQEAARKTP